MVHYLRRHTPTRTHTHARISLSLQAGEFLDLWVETKYIRVGQNFPNTRRRAAVVEKRNVYKNPIEMALASMLAKNAELVKKIDEMELLRDGGADQSYTMTLNGVVDAAVNGGVENYRTMINGKFRDENPEIAEDVDNPARPDKRTLPSRLAESVTAQLKLLERGISIHKTKVSEAMAPLAEVMEDNFYTKLVPQLEEIIASAVV